jgi:hypothetical protein
MAGFLLSRMRSGLLCRRRLRVLVELVGVLLEVGDQRLAVRLALVGLAQAVELEAHVAPSTSPSSRHSARAIRIISASTSGPAKPSASTPSWWNWR